MPEDGRGSLPFSLLHGESLIAVAAFALEAAGVELVDPRIDVATLHEAERALVLHDPLCPATPVGFLGEAVDLAVASGTVVVAVRPVTDTVKALLPGGLVGATHDREALVEVASPIVLPPAVVATLDAIPAGDFAAIVDAARQRWPVRFVEAPAAARRVRRPADLALLEAVAG